MKSARAVHAADSALSAEAAFPRLLDRFDAPASDEAVARTAQALQRRGFVVRVFEKPAEAVEFIDGHIKDGETVSMGGSTTLSQLGVIDALKRREAAVTNFKALALEARAKGDLAGFAAISAKGASADWFMSSVSAVTEDGVLHAADFSGSRISGWLAAKRLFLVLGTNKIVPDEEAAEHRLVEYQLPLESARLRATTTFKSSTIANRIQMVHPGAAFAAGAPSRVTVIIVKGAWGF